MRQAEAKRLLANPIWNTLTTNHTTFAEKHKNFLRYPANILPFAGVETAGIEVSAAEALTDGTLYFAGPSPTITGTGFTTANFTCLQMLYEGPLTSPETLPNEEELTLANAPDMVALTDVTFPGYFRAETPRLGRYLGLRENDELISMAGERFRLPGLWEISAVCTRPGFTGKGYAAHLMQRLVNHRKTEQCFLHVIESNKRAIDLYHHLGFIDLSTVNIMKVAAATT